MKTVLITGCNGLIGEALVKNLVKKEVFNLYGIGRALRAPLHIIQLDLSGYWSDKELPGKIDFIIHLAQSEKFREFPDSAEEVFNVNTGSTLKLLEYARKAGAKKFIYASSGGVYGNSDIGFNEDSPLQMNKDLGFYLTTKFCSELIVQNYTQFFDINILRFFFTFGEKQRRDMLIPRLVESVKTGKPIILQGKEGISINPIYVEDAVQAIARIIETKGSFNVNIGGSEIVTIKQIGEMIGKHAGKAPVFEYREGEVKNLIGDINKMKSLYVPKISLDEAFKKMI
jgi:UDP-glucose 4-epimerase